MSNRGTVFNSKRVLQSSTANPAAGANASFTQLGMYSTQLILLSFTLTTDANIANRYIEIHWHHALTDVIIAQTTTPVTAGKTTALVASPNHSEHLTTVTFKHTFTLPSHIEIPITDHLTLEVDGIQVGDQLSDIQHWWLIQY